MKRWKKISHANGRKNPGVTIFITEKIEFKTMTITKTRKGST